MRAHRLVVAAVLCLFSGACLLRGEAQKSIDIEEVRRLVLYFEIEAGADFTPQQGTLLYESLVTSLSDSSDRVALLEYRDQSIPGGDQEKSTMAEDIGADSWLHVTVGGDFESAHLQVRCLDLLNGIIAFELDLQKELLRGTRELGTLFWNEVQEAAREYFERALNLENRIGDLTFQALPGTRIQGVGDRPLKITDDGTAAAEVALPSTIPFRATKPGYWPVEGQIYMDQPEKSVVIEQTPGDRVALDFYLNNFNFPGFDFTFFLVPEMVFAKTGILTYLIGFVLEGGGDSDSEVLVSFSLNHYNLAMGFYLNAPDRYFRPYFAAGAFWRIITARGYWGFEPIAPFGLQPILGFEYSRQHRYKLFFEYAPMVHWTGNSDDTFLFLSSVSSDNEFTGYESYRWCVINFVNFKLGLRVIL
jgi:hypothetical protein